jgi:hypothetical protein
VETITMNILSRALVSGLTAGTLSMWTLAQRGRSEGQSAARMLNAPSHWLFGDRALAEHAPSWRYTGTGTLIHESSAVMWALLFERLVSRRDRAPSLASIAASAAVVTGVAAVVDLKLVPERLTPGFEHHLSGRGLLLVYASVAAGLALSGWLMRSRPPR